MATLSPEEAFHQQWRIVRGIGISMAAERQRGNEAGVLALKPYFTANLAKLRVLAQAANDADLTAWDRFVLQVDRGVGTALSVPSLTFKALVGPYLPLVYLALGVAALHYLSPVMKRVAR